ncbi:MAG: type II toxin-antitoxin system Phd/YefM family antitoxin [Phycisphaerae bacterium]|nr:type II toxin-antitoxin system Phd/YefM family antitoxin [Phycisphaerae bacterium]
MKTVGVKALKNNLSRYLKLVKQGETILITERDEVIAEMHEPTIRPAHEGSRWEAFLNRLEREGRLRRAARKVSRVKSLMEGKPKWPEDLDWKAIHEDVKSDRF